MKRFLAAMLFLLSVLMLPAQVDGAFDRNGELAAKLQAYCAAMVQESAATQSSETDYIIESCTDAATRQYVAVWLYTHYFTSKVMGHDAVAIHIFDRWFADGDLKFYEDTDWFNAYVFAEMNRMSLIGMKAPATRLYDADGLETVLFEKATGKPALLYFYSTDCSKCKIENIMVRNVIENLDLPIDVFAVCTNGSREEWESVQASALNFNVTNTEVLHLWDPGEKKAWKSDWGLLQTPSAFLIDAEGTIAGRGLDSNAIEKMLQEMFRSSTMSYGDPSSKDFYDQLFADGSSPEVLLGSAAHIARRTLDETRDTLLFKQLTGDLLYYLSSSEDGNLRNGLPEFIQQQILDRSDVWTTPNDTLQIVGLAQMLKEIGERAPVGEKLPSAVVYGQKISPKGDGKVRRRSLRLLPDGYTYIMFYSPTCSDCMLQSALLEERLKTEDFKVLKVNLDEMQDRHPKLFERLIEKFDLTHLPYITRLEKGKVAEKYCRF